MLRNGWLIGMEYKRTRHGPCSETIQGGGHQPAVSRKKWQWELCQAGCSGCSQPASPLALTSCLHKAHPQPCLCCPGLVHCPVLPSPLCPSSSPVPQTSMASPHISPCPTKCPQTPLPRGRHLSRPSSRSKRTPLGRGMLRFLSVNISFILCPDGGGQR